MIKRRCVWNIGFGWLGEEKRSRCPSRYLFRAISIFIYSVFASSSLVRFVDKKEEKNTFVFALCAPMRRAEHTWSSRRYEARNNKSEIFFFYELIAFLSGVGTIRDLRALCNKSKGTTLLISEMVALRTIGGKMVKKRFDANCSDITSPLEPNYDGDSDETFISTRKK